MFLSIYYYKSILIGLCKMMNNHSLCTALQIFTYCYNINDIIYMISSLSLSLQITTITVVGSLSSSILVLVGLVIIIHSRTLPPPSSSLFDRLIDLDCCDGYRGQGGSLMLVLLGFVLGFGSNNFGGCRGQRGQLVLVWVFARSKVDLFLDFGAMVGLAMR